jgi:alanyl-tRNA synthetase
MATADVVQEGFNAGELVGEVARITGGGGGGRPDMAQAGGSKPELLPQALEQGRKLARKQLGE